MHCPLFISAYEKGKGRHTFGIIEFKSPSKYKAIASIDCNGSQWEAFGTAICQSNTGLIQKIKFKYDSIFKSDCPESFEKSGNSYKIKLGKGICLTTFKVGEDFFRLTLYGFEQVLVY